MSKILALVFSKDRASQLDLLLRSIHKNCPDVFKIVVLFKASNYNLLSGYTKVIRKINNRSYGEEIDIVQESNFKEDVLEILETKVHEHKTVCFLTDDSVFYSPFKLNDDELSEFLNLYQVFSFSTRLGRNIKYQNHWTDLEVANVQKEEVYICGQQGFTWEVCTANLGEDFGRPVSMDGNIHLLDEMLYLMQTNDWKCVRSLDAIQPRQKNLYSSAFDKSVLVNIPINLTYGGNADNYGKWYVADVDFLNSQWLQGNELDLSIVENVEVITSHQEYDFFPLPQFVEGPDDVKEIINENFIQDNTTPERPTSSG